MNEDRKKSLQTFLFKILTPLFSILILFCLLEVVLLIIRSEPMKAIQNASKTGKYFLKRSDDQYIRYELNPNYQGTIDKVKIRINSQGFRGREYGVNKKDRICIILLGDSITFAKTFEEGKTYAVLLGKLLQKLNPKIEVLNMGVDGYDTLQEVLQF